MEAKIVTLPTLKLIGNSVETSLSEQKTVALWKQFKPRVSEIKNRIDENFYSVQFYPAGISMQEFTPITEFTKWAAVAVDNHDHVPSNMETTLIPGGLYAQFIHKGKAADFFRTSQYIFGTWLPQSGYQLDHRPHFEVMSPDYTGPNDPNTEELVYVPIK